MGLFGFVGWLLQYGYGRGGEQASSSVVVDIPQGTSVRGISRILGEAGVIDDDIRFMLLARWQGVATRLRAGEFELPLGKTPLEVLDILIRVKPYQRSITIPEGLRGEEIAELFAREGWCDPYVFAELLLDEDFIRELGLEDVSSLEGYLFPDTYFLTKEMRGSKNIITMQVNRFHQVWGEIVRDLEKEPDRKETVILASIVEKETGDAAERPIIASVFHNRLRIGMKLQSDPTVVYGTGAFDAPITRTDLKTPTPYNTYVIPALPAGPIANPGRAAIEAVVHPAAGRYLYFVSKNDGTHHFSTNLREHNNAVNKYQRKNGDKSGKD